MAGHDDGQERTEQATPRRMQDAAKQGQVVRSRELVTLAMLLAGATGLLVLGPALLEGLAAQMRAGLTLDPKKIVNASQIPAALGQAFTDLLLLLAPFLGLMLVVALIAPLALGGWTFSLKLRWEHLNVLKGVGRLFSWQALMELTKALIKFLVVGGAAVVLLWQGEAELLHLGREPLLPAHRAAAAGAGPRSPHSRLDLSGLDLADAVDRRRGRALSTVYVLPQPAHDQTGSARRSERHRGQTRSQGPHPPLAAGIRIRRLQQEFARRRMMEKVPTADVIVTNPNHYAVALQYRPDTMKAPVIVALGVEMVALRIRELAARHRIPRVESPLLARALYFNGALDKPIRLYQAVAQVLAYVYRLRRDGELTGDPIAMSEVPVPSELRTE